MDSRKLLGVPVSATESAPPVLSPSTSTGIRAPLTLDDSEYSSYGSDSGVDSDGFLSGEEGFETALERAFVAGTNDEIDHQDAHFIKQNVVSRPLVKIPPKEINYGTSTDEEIVENDVSGEGSGPMPVLAVKCVAHVGTSVDENEIASEVDLPVVPLLQKQGIPIAKLSGDSDGDSLESEGVEEETYLGVTSVPSSGIVERLASDPEVLDVGGGDGHASFSDYGSETELEEESILVGGDNVEETHMDNGLISAEVIEDMGTEAAEEAVGVELHERFQDFNGDSGEDKFDIGDNDPNKVIDQETNCLIILETNDVELTEVKAAEREAKDSFGAASVDHVKCTDETVDGNGSIVLSPANEGEKLTCRIEQGVDAKLRSHCRKEFDNVESLDNGTVEKEVIMNYGKLSDVQVAEDPECYRNGHVDVHQRLAIENSLCSGFPSPQAILKCIKLGQEGTCEVKDDSVSVEDDNYSVGDNAIEKLDVECSDGGDTIDQLEHSTAPSPLSNGESSDNHLPAQVARELHDETDVHRHNEVEETFDDFSFTALPRTDTGVESESGSVMLTSVDGKSLSPQEQSFDSESRFLDLRPTAEPSPTHSTPGQMDNGESVENLSQGEKGKIDRLQELRVKFLRLVRRLNMSPEDSVAAKVLCQLELAAGRLSVQAFNFDFAKQKAMQLEEKDRKDMNFSLNILVIGKSGVGKSATINSISGEEKARVSAFEPVTTSVKEIMGTIDGIQVHFLDTPGFRSSPKDQSFNQKILSSIKRFTKKFPPDVVLYVDRIDTHFRDLTDLPLLKKVMSYLGSSIWCRIIIILTHATSVPPEEPSGYPLSYDTYVSARSRVVQQMISHSVGNFHTIKPGLIPVVLIENCSTCEMIKSEQTFLPSEDSWRSQLLLLCYSMKILSEIESVIKTDGDFSSSMLYFMSSLSQSNSHPKLSSEGGESFDSNLDQQSDNECDQLPQFMPPTESEVAKLTKEQRDTYFEKYDYCIKLFQKRQRNDKVRRFQNVKKKDTDGHEAIAVSQPKMVLPLSLDGYHPANRYQLLVSTSPCLTRPVLELHGFDHDCGYDGISFVDKLGIAGISITRLGGNMIVGFKVEDEIALGKDLVLAGSTGLVKSETDAAFGANLEIHLKEKNSPTGQDQSALCLSLTKWRGDLILGLNLQSQISVGRRNSKMTVRAGLNSNKRGQFSTQTSSSGILLIATLGLPIAKTIWRTLFSPVAQG